MKKSLVIFILTFIAVVNFSFDKVSYTTINFKNTKKAPSTQVQIAFVPTLEDIQNSNNLEVPFVGKSFTGFKNALGFKESQNRYHITNKLGYLGKYQFGKSTLKRLKIYNTQEFLNDAKQQEKAFEALCALNKHILRKDIKRSVGKKINGIRITESGIIAAAHLGGAGNVKKYLRSNGETNFSDAFGSSIQYYMKKFSGFDVSNIEANKNPII